MRKWIVALIALAAANSLLFVVAAFGAISVIVVLFRLTGLLS